MIKAVLHLCFWCAGKRCYNKRLPGMPMSLSWKAVRLQMAFWHARCSPNCEYGEISYTGTLFGAKFSCLAPKRVARQHIAGYGFLACQSGWAGTQRG